MNTTTLRRGRMGSRLDLALRAKGNDSLSLDEMRQRLPAIFAAEPHSSRSERYVYISTQNMLGELIRRDFLPVEARVSRSRDAERAAHTKHMVRLRHASDLRGGGERRVGDTSFEVILRNAHDGTASYQFMAGLLRLVCLNGMVVSDGTVADVKVLHTGNRQRQIEQVVEGAYALLERGPAVMDTVRSWQTIDLQSNERMALAEAAHTVRFGDSEGNVATPIQPAQLLNPRRYDDRKTDLWTTFNVIQENAIRGGLTGVGRDAQNRVRRSTSREVRSIDGDIKLNRALWQLAEKMASLKVGA